MSPRERSLPFRTDQVRKRGGTSRDRALMDRLRSLKGAPVDSGQSTIPPIPAAPTRVRMAG